MVVSPVQRVLVIFLAALMIPILVPAGPAQEPALPDLQVDGWHPDGDVQEHAVVNVYPIVSNRGDVASGPFTVRLYDESGLVAEEQVEDLGPGSGRGLAAHRFSNATVGSLSYRIEVDPDDAVAESNETNNIATHGFGVMPQPADRFADLRPAGITILDGQWDGGTYEMLVRIRLANQGDWPAGPFITKLDHHTFAARTFHREGQSTEFVGAFGTYLRVTDAGPVEMEIDARGWVPEHSEGNNVARFRLPLPFPTDLNVTHLETSYVAPVLDRDRIDVVARVANDGNGSSAADVRLRHNGAVVATEAVYVPGGTEVELRFQARAQEGANTFQVEVEAAEPDIEPANDQQAATVFAHSNNTCTRPLRPASDLYWVCGLYYG